MSIPSMWTSRSSERSSELSSRRTVASSALATLATASLVLGGCSSVDEPVDIAEVDPAKYDLEFLRCEPESIEDTEAALGDSPLSETTEPRVVAEYRITNRDDTRRRFDIRATRTDSSGVTVNFNPHDTDPLDAGESGTGQIRLRVSDGDVPPYTCTADVWDSVIDIAFPDD